MRITNQMIQNTSMYNLNKNKGVLETSERQMSTRKKIARPSENPIDAMRSLRFSTALSQIDQYLNRNVQDAKSWLDLTSNSLDNASEILTSMVEKATQGNNDYLNLNNLESILGSLESLSTEFFSVANSDYSGRYIFSGFKTDTPISFLDKTNQTYQINEGSLDIEKVSFVKTNSNCVTSVDTIRIKLAYDDIDNSNVTISVNNESINVLAMNRDDALDFIKNANDNNEEKAVFIKETGEILCSSKMNERLSSSDFSVSYSKSNWVKGDVRPEHYFNCSSNGINYTQQSDKILYDVGYNQSVNVNVAARDVFGMDVKSIINDFKYQLNSLKELDNMKNNVDININEVYDTVTNNIHKVLTKAISVFQGGVDKITIMNSDVGTRLNRAELIERRLEDQYLNFTDLKQKNDDVDLAMAATNLTNASNAYQASLMAISKTASVSLLDFLK